VIEADVLGVDPGTAKCGLAVVDARGEVRERAVVAVAELAERLAQLAGAYPLTQIVCGDRTGAEPVRVILQRVLPEVPLATVAEHGSTEQARELYWQYHPPQGWRRLMPRGMLLPPTALDGYAAELLVRRWRSGG
jgi:RNase H-fold protein (predicted Holliday junction resolvase)